MPNKVINRVHDIAIRQKSPEGLILLRQDKTKFVKVDGSDNTEQEVDNTNMPAGEDDEGADDAPEEANIGVDNAPEVAVQENYNEYHEPTMNHDAEAIGVGFADNGNYTVG